MSMRPAALAAVILATAAPSARSSQITDGTSNTIMVAELIGTRTVELVKSPGLPWLRYEVVPRLQNPQPLVGVSRSAAGIAVHSGGGGSATMTTALFFAGAGAVPNAPFTLRDQQSGLVTLPGTVRTLAVDPSDPSGGAVLLSASTVLLPGNQVRGVNLIREASGEAVLVDYDFAGGPPRRTPLGLTAPLGPTKGSVVALADGRAWVALPCDSGLALFALGKLPGTGPLEPTLMGTLPVAASFDPASTQLGIIAILIGLMVEPAPSLSIQEGNRLRLYAHDGDEFRLMAEQTLIPGAHGLMEEEGIDGGFFYYTSQGNLWRGVVGGGPGSLVNLGH